MDGIRKQMAALKTSLKVMLDKKIKELNVKTKAAVDKMETNLKAVEENTVGCNYATHYKKDNKCVLLTDCNAGDKNVQYNYDRQGKYISQSRYNRQGHAPKGYRRFPSAIGKPATKTSDRVCYSPSFFAFYDLSDMVRFHMVRWPAWKYPLYSEYALVAVCKEYGLK